MFVCCGFQLPLFSSVDLATVCLCLQCKKYPLYRWLSENDNVYLLYMHSNWPIAPSNVGLVTVSTYACLIAVYELPLAMLVYIASAVSACVCCYAGVSKARGVHLHPGPDGGDRQ